MGRITAVCIILKKSSKYDDFFYIVKTKIFNIARKKLKLYIEKIALLKNKRPEDQIFIEIILFAGEHFAF